jgi:hypothetical protein
MAFSKSVPPTRSHEQATLVWINLQSGLKLDAVP